MRDIFVNQKTVHGIFNPFHLEMFKNMNHKLIGS